MPFLNRGCGARDWQVLYSNSGHADGRRRGWCHSRVRGLPELPNEPGGNPLEQVVPQVAVVLSRETRTYFVRGNGTAGCPSDAAACRARAYVVPHDTVLVVRTKGPYACALLTSPRGTTTENWLPASALTAAPQKPPALRDWIGEWRTGDQHIAISMAPPGAGPGRGLRRTQR